MTATRTAPSPTLAPHWCPGCWVAMPDGSEGKCSACKGPLDYCGGTVHFFFGDLRWAGPGSDHQYHGIGYQG